MTKLPDDELIEIRCLWQRTDYGYIMLLAAARGYGGRKLGICHDQITDERFAKMRKHSNEVYPNWRVAESVIKVRLASIEALFTDGTEVEAVEDQEEDQEERTEGVGWCEVLLHFA